MGKTRTYKGKHKSWDHPEMGYNKYVPDSQFRSCAKKTGAYGHEKEALAIAAGFTRTDGIEWRAYECKHCGKWHLTSGTNRKQKGATQ